MPTIEQLEELLGRDPDDVFLNFGLAMALVSAGRPDDALERFAQTLSLDANYIPAYFQKAQLLSGLGRSDEARQTLEDGIGVAEKTSDAHAAGEMREFLAQIT